MWSVVSFPLARMMDCVGTDFVPVVFKKKVIFLHGWNDEMYARIRSLSEMHLMSHLSKQSN